MKLRDVTRVDPRALCGLPDRVKLKLQARPSQRGQRSSQIRPVPVCIFVRPAGTKDLVRDELDELEAAYSSAYANDGRVYVATCFICKMTQTDSMIARIARKVGFFFM